MKQTPFAYEIVPDAQPLLNQLSLSVYPAHIVLNPKGEAELTLYGAGERNVAQVRNVLARLIAAQ